MGATKRLKMEMDEEMARAEKFANQFSRFIEEITPDIAEREQAYIQAQQDAEQQEWERRSEDGTA